ncbi:unnamed protein product [Ectocarpus sp. 6 AP-2014]
MRRVAMPLRRQREAKLGGGGAVAAAAAGPPQAYPMDLNTVKGILREFDRAAYGEAFRGDRLAKIAFLGRGSTSTVWKVVDIETLRVVAVKEMIVCDSKQGTILRHELSVLHPQLQPWSRPNRNGCRGEGAGPQRRPSATPPPPARTPRQPPPPPPPLPRQEEAGKSRWAAARASPPRPLRRRSSDWGRARTCRATTAPSSRTTTGGGRA